MALRVWLVVALFASAPAVGHAAATYDAPQRTITVTGFSNEFPGTLGDVLEADEQGRWGVVSYRADTQTFMVNARLCIGAADGPSTWFRIGTPERPREVLVVQGDLRVAQPSTNASNTVWIGAEKDAAITPTVSFDCQTNRQYGLLLGPGSSVHIFNATITAATQDRNHMARCLIETGDLVIAHSRLSWIADPGLLYGSSSLHSPLRGVTLEHGQTGLYNLPQWAEDCLFRDLDIAVCDGGCLDATLVRCRFEGNKRNWDLVITQFGITAVDCYFGQEKDPGPHILRWRNPNTGRWQYPSFVALRHIVLKVQDEAAKPIPGALVEVTEASGDVSAVHHGLAKTDAEGRTPAADAYGALLLADYAYRATDDPPGDSAECRIASYDYRYSVQVTAEGYQPAVLREVDPDESWTEKVVTLRRQ